MMMLPQMGPTAPINGGYAPMGPPAGQMPMMPQQPMQGQAPQQDMHPQMRMQLINALENFASR